MEKQEQNGDASEGFRGVVKDEQWYATLPRFYGDDPFGWLFLVEKYFLENSIEEDDDKLEVAVACLLGEAMEWCIWFESRITIQSWDHFKREVIKHFHDLLLSSNLEIKKIDEGKKVEAKLSRGDDEPEKQEEEDVTEKSVNGDIVIEFEVDAHAACVEARIKGGQKFHANTIKSETWMNRSMYFRLPKTKDVAETSQGNWILDRVSKAHWGRNPKFIWAYNSCGPGCFSEPKSHLIANTPIYFTQRTERCDEGKKTLTLDPWFAATVFTLNPPFATSATRVGQVEDAGEMANCRSVNVNEAYGVLCLVLGATGFKFSDMEEFTHLDRREDMESTGHSNLQGTEEVKIKKGLRVSVFTRIFGPNIFLAQSHFSQVMLIAESNRGYFSAITALYNTETWRLNPLLATTMFSLSSYFAESAARLWQLTRLEATAETANYFLVNEPFEALHMFLSAQGFELPTQIQIYSINARDDFLYLPLDNYMPKSCAVKRFQAFHILLGREDHKEEIVMPLVSAPTVFKQLTWRTFLDACDIRYAPTKTRSWGFVTPGSFAMEWDQTDLIHNGLMVSYYELIRDISKFIEEGQRLIGHSNPTGAPDFGQLRSLVRVLKLLHLLRYIYETIYTLRIKDEKGRCSSKKEVGGISCHIICMLQCNKFNEGSVLLFLVPMGKSSELFGWNCHGVQDLVPATNSTKQKGFMTNRNFYVDWVQIGFICFGWKICYCFVSDPSRQLVDRLLMLSYSLPQPRLVFAETPLITACSFNFWLGMCQFLVTIIEEIITIVKLAKVVITAIIELVGTWIKTLDTEVARSREFRVTLCNVWVLGSRNYAHVCSPSKCHGLNGKVLEFASYNWKVEANYGAFPVGAISWFCKSKGHEEESQLHFSQKQQRNLGGIRHAFLNIEAKDVVKGVMKNDRVNQALDLLGMYELEDNFFMDINMTSYLQKLEDFWSSSIRILMSTSTHAFHLEDKVRLLGGGNDETRDPFGLHLSKNGPQHIT